MGADLRRAHGEVGLEGREQRLVGLQVLSQHGEQIRLAFGGGGDDGGSGPSPELALDRYHVVNVGAAQDIPGTTAQLFGRVDNLFDENYVENFGFPQAGRTFRAGLKAKY